MKLRMESGRGGRRPPDVGGQEARGQKSLRGERKKETESEKKIQD